MADDVQVTEIEKEAASYGWKPQDQLPQGVTFIPAAEFVERGRQIMPILRENNKTLRTEVAGLKETLQRMERERVADRVVLQTLEESRDEELRASKEAAREELKRELAEAVQAGDSVKVAELTSDLVQNAAELAVAAKPKPKAKANGEGGDGAQPTQVDVATMKAWLQANPEFSKNSRKLALANAVAHEMRVAGDKRVGSEFLDAVAEEVNNTLGGTGAPSRDSKVEGGGRPNGGGGSGSVKGKTYNDLPAEAKAICDRQAVRFVGPNRAHKDTASWQAKYAQTYFAQEQQ